ncbi:nocturnin-like isoform X1 [Hypanus sabinus]|uniref:nocturnin-like isoform X1 n=2 Tax=Hypanus sabinus TaxID=79690 RepID=UPI0028C46E0E|nr:nocturnin-like isoform X1 [Hypanus sabinus]
MYQVPARLCATLFQRDLLQLMSGSSPVFRRRLPLRKTDSAGGASDTVVPEAAAGAAATGGGGAGVSFTAAAVCSMGTSATRLYSTLAPTITDNGIPQTQEEYAVETNLEPVDPTDPNDILKECQRILENRPPRLKRDFLHLRKSSQAGDCRPIKVLQWNILAQALGEWKDNFIKCPREALKWSERKYLILEEILTYHPDILCLQEVDHYFDTFQPVLSGLGYHSTFFPKPFSPCLAVEHNNGPDGCALFFLRERFELINTVTLRLVAKMLQTNQVAIIQTLRCIETGRMFCVAVTHLKACSGWERFRTSQGCDLLQKLENITGAGIPLIVCGDFNAEPTEDVYKQFTKSKLNLNSAYKLLSEDGQSEPPFTTWKIRPSGESCLTLDYIWYSQHAFAVNRLLNLPTEEQIGPNRLPSFHYPSDHLSLVCEFSFLDQLDDSFQSVAGSDNKV